MCVRRYLGVESGLIRSDPIADEDRAILIAEAMKADIARQRVAFTWTWTNRRCDLDLVGVAPGDLVVAWVSKSEQEVVVVARSTLVIW